MTINARFAATYRFGYDMSPQVEFIRPGVPRQLTNTLPLLNNGLWHLGGAS
ncbi:MAG: hypothetical protein ACRD9R_01550 [Pyrinomonadaceae bacterium]